ncbi:MAG: hypothetical protein IKD92_03815 [Lachnospiraceae bacterium]|nr:hypothetical protein [Lachnospiraceae bacterium]
MEPRSLPSRSSCRRTLMLPPGSRKVYTNVPFPLCLLLSAGCSVPATESFPVPAEAPSLLCGCFCFLCARYQAAAREPLPHEDS